MKYLICIEETDALLAGVEHDSDEAAEDDLADRSAKRPGGLLLFRDQKLMAWAREGVVHSFRDESLHDGLQRIAS